MTQGFLNNLKRADRQFEPQVIFDVGANIGLTTELFSALLP